MIEFIMDIISQFQFWVMAHQMWIAIAFTVATLIAFGMEKQPIEVTALFVLVTLLVFYALFPVIGENGTNQLSTVKLLSGIGNPSLIAVLALLVIGQAMVQTDALTPVIAFLLKVSKFSPILTLAIALAGVLVISGILNNTPLVIMFIPVMQTLAVRMKWSVSRIMMPLSYAAILGGMTTLIGSSTNLLVSSTLVELGSQPINFFDMTIPGLMLGGVGLIYVLFILPRILPDRASMAEEMLGPNKQFIAEIPIGKESTLLGLKPENGIFPKMEDITVRLIHRGGMVILPPFDNYTIKADDILIVAATRPALTDLLAATKGFFVSEDDTAVGAEIGTDTIQNQEETSLKSNDDEEHVLTELMVAPASRLIEQTLNRVAFRRRYNCRVLGVQRRARMVRGRLSEIRLQAGDVLLVLGDSEHIRALRNIPDLIRLAWSTREVPKRELAPRAFAIFLVTVLLAAFGILPISVTAPAGAALMILSKTLNIRQAARAMDRKIILLVAASLALSAAMDKTGAAEFLAMQLLHAIPNPTPMLTASILFIIIAIATNVLSNNACAVLFTPIAVGLAAPLNMDPMLMAYTVIFAANCSFASPIGYQTNLLVMGPGHYKFSDFLRGGAPLILIIWAAYCIIFPWYFNLSW